MRNGILLIALGIVSVLCVVGINAFDRRVLVGERRDVAGLTTELDSVRAMLRSAATVADSTRLAESVRDREYRLGRRAFHLPIIEERVRTWWHLTGAGAIGAGIGLLFVCAGVWTLRARREAREGTA